MERKIRPVKSPRRYDSSRRRTQALQTRAAIIDVARRRFLSDGFAPTTIAAIAEEVGVSVDTVYKGFGGKPGLVRAICAQGLAGEGPVHAEQRSDTLQATESDPRALMRGLGQLTAEVTPRVAPMLLLVRDAASGDQNMADLRAELDAERLARMVRNARNLAAAGHLRTGLSVEEAGEIMWLYTAPELYELLIVKRGWSLPRFAAFITATLSAALLGNNE